METSIRKLPLTRACETADGAGDIAVRPSVRRFSEVVGMSAPPTPAPPASARATSPLLMSAQLDAQWRRRRRDPRALRRAASWGLVPAPIGSLDQVLTAVGFEVPASPTTEANLRRLVEHARRDTLAAEVVVQRLLPGALSLAARRQRDGVRDAVADTLGALWIAVRTFNPSRRPGCVAAALLGDADYLAFRSNWRRTRRELPRESFAELPAPDPRDDPAAELDDLLAAAAAVGAATADDVDLVRRLLDDPSPTRVAAALELNERTVRNRRDRLVTRLRGLAVAA